MTKNKKNSNITLDSLINMKNCTKEHESCLSLEEKAYADLIKNLQKYESDDKKLNKIQTKKNSENRKIEKNSENELNRKIENLNFKETQKISENNFKKETDFGNENSINEKNMEVLQNLRKKEELNFQNNKNDEAVITNNYADLHDLIMQTIRQEIKICFKKEVIPAITKSFNEIHQQIKEFYTKSSNENNSNETEGECIISIKKCLNKKRHSKIIKTENLFKQLLKEIDLYVMFIETIDINILMQVESRKLYKMLEHTENIFESDNFVYGILYYLSLEGLSEDESRNLKNILFRIKKGNWFGEAEMIIPVEMKVLVDKLHSALVRKSKGLI